jgi:hypothetical protein
VVTERDLRAARSFTRRRLVAALVSGNRGDQEVERAHPWRAAVGGTALALLLLAGAAASGVLAGHLVAEADHCARPSASTAAAPPDPVAAVRRETGGG